MDATKATKKIQWELTAGSTVLKKKEQETDELGMSTVEPPFNEPLYNEVTWMIEGFLGLKFSILGLFWVEKMAIVFLGGLI